MKIIKLTLSAVVCALAFCACTDAKDCLCEVEVPSKSTVNTKATSFQPVYDWEGSCSGITAEDVPGLSDDPCKEM